MSNNEIKINQGEQLSFSELFLDKKWKVEIPIIQRDYAQGRGSAISIRNNFLDSLLSHLLDNSNIDLDFVYGSINSNNNSLFIPLDGQQRLTTLFLLHWYLANLDNKIDHFQSILVTGNKSNFTYETRSSAREFCNELVRAEIDLDNLINNSLSQTIKDKAWYFGSWDNDPTIKAMLIMLDAIHEKFSQTENLYERLTNIDTPIITFQFLNLKKFRLTDDLYIKMNARGKQLTDFENFKAKFEQLIKSKKLKKVFKLELGKTLKEVKVHDYFSHKIDTVWANLFWNYRNDNIEDNYFDDEIMNFIRLVITNHYAVISTDSDKVEKIQMLIGRDDSETNLTYLQYKELNSFDDKFILDLISIFDLLTNGDKTIKTYLSGNEWHFNETHVFKLALSNKTGYRDKIRFYAFYQYLILFGTTEGLDTWMRVVYNLTENVIYNRPEEFIRSIQAIESVLPQSNHILNYLSDSSNKLSGFPDVQIFEERIKSHLILKDDTWKDTVESAEKHGYFTGQIGFILNFSGIEEFYTEHLNCDWDNNEDSQYLKSFNEYCKKSKAVFSDDGLNKFSSHSWHRALFSMGDYLLSKGSNWSFLIDDERDISWKRLFRDSNSNRRELVKKLFDDTDFSINELEKSLKTIIDKYNGDDWRKHFVELPDILDYLGTKKFIRWVSETEIYLLRGERLSGEHAEYYSYAFYLKYLSSPLLPFENVDYYSPSGNEELPCVYMKQWEGKDYAIDIYYVSATENAEIRFYKENSGTIENSIEKILQKMGMTITTEYEDQSYIITKSDEDETYEFLKDLTNELTNLK